MTAKRILAGMTMALMLAAMPGAAASAAALSQDASPIAPTADTSLTARANELVGVIAGTGDYQGYFAKVFHDALPKDKWDAVVAGMTAQMGKPVAIDSIKPVSPFNAYLRIRFERGIVLAQIAVDPAVPHQVVGLLFSGSEMTGDSLDKIGADFRALSGKSAFGVYVLGPGAPRLVAGLNSDQPAPLGSAFKLWVLGELTRSVSAGERKWTDVVPVGPASLPSGMTQAWPAASPATLHTLASLMISISDNTATDTLVSLEGTKLDTFVTKAGAPGLAPIMSTRQMFAIKAAPNAALAAQWTTTLSPSARRKWLDANAAKLAATPVDPAMFTEGKPVAIDTLEWFASPAQSAAMLDWFRTSKDALGILGINPGVDPATRAKFDYVGYKGGSEPGVISLTFLVKRKDGRWLAIVANWWRSDSGVDATAFTALLTRTLTSIADAKLPD